MPLFSPVPPRKAYPEGTLLLGSPAKAARTLTEDEIRHLKEHAESYRDLWRAYRAHGIGALKGKLTFGQGTPRPLTDP